MTKLLLLIGLYVSFLVVLHACGLANGLLGNSGVAPNANTPEARELARQADESFLAWWNYILGPAAGIAVDRTQKAVRGKFKIQRAKKAAIS